METADSAEIETTAAEVALVVDDRADLVIAVADSTETVVLNEDR